MHLYRYHEMLLTYEDRWSRFWQKSTMRRWRERGNINIRKANLLFLCCTIPEWGKRFFFIRTTTTTNKFILPNACTFSYNECIYFSKEYFMHITLQRRINEREMPMDRSSIIYLEFRITNEIRWVDRLKLILYDIMSSRTDIIINHHDLEAHNKHTPRNSLRNSFKT